MMAVGSVAFPFLTSESILDPLAMLVFISGYILGILIWYLPKSDANSRGVSTTLSFFVSTWGIVLLLSATGSIFLLSLIITSIGIFVSIGLWRSELMHVIIQTFEAILKAASYAIQTIKSFFGSYYREMVTLIVLGVMIIGSLAYRIIGAENYDDPLPIILFIVGYGIGVVVWYIPSPHDSFQRVCTILSTVVSFWGIILGILTGNLLIVPLGLISLGVIVNGWVWRTELSQLLRLVKEKVGIVIGEMVNSIIPLLLLAFAIPAILYAIFVLIYALVPSIGAPLDTFLIEYVPGIEFLAKIIQGGIYEGKLIGDLEDTEPFMKLIFSAIIILLGVVLIVIVALRREGMQLNSLLNRSRSQTKSSSFKHTIDLSDKDGDDKK
jgi:hypothetical protein